MARDKKTPQNDVSTEAETVQDQEDALAVEAVPSDVGTSTEMASEEPMAEGDAADPEAEVSEETHIEDQDDTSKTDESTRGEDIPKAERADARPVIEKSAVKRGGLVPTLLGGVICVALGYAGAQFIKPEGWPFPGANTDELAQQLTDLSAQLADLKSSTQDQIAATHSAQDRLKSEIEAQIAAIDPGQAIQPLQDQLSNFESRLTEFEARPVAEAVVSPEATAAYERQLAEMQNLLTDEIARLEAAKAQSAAEEKAATAATQKARLQRLVDAGDPFASVLYELEEDAPAALKEAAQNGIASVTELQDTYPDAARAALMSASRAAYEAGEQGWFDTALQTQLGLRSTKPKEGDDADAILSRAEDAVRKGQFASAITTLEALPEAGQAEMQPWIEQAQKRVDVMAALNEMLGQ
ncbi:MULTISPECIES: hypothetical protein [Roseobacteraceae]|uniref:COG4223 family protein n=1 Tax=Roseobacteraceae TaxID=2854170 RepID=UPI0012600278|nr:MULTISPECIES: hypothetical protein [Roseobacteraceae]KAB6716619.1 hypothetical protein C8029_09495 [Roseobacter sp. TSBP12]